jgi:prolyl 4-hydroxylase
MYKCIIDDSWKAWAQSNMANGAAKHELFTILLNYGYEYDVIVQLLEYQPDTQKIINRKDIQGKYLVKERENVVQMPYKILADNPRAHRIDTALADIYEINNFLSADECKGIIDLMSRNLQPSTVTDPNADRSVRTSSTSHLNCLDPLIEIVERRMHSTMQISLNQGEELQGQRYLVGQEFKSHTDYFDGNVGYNQVHLDRGQRTWTLMVYLNDVEEGGFTKFTKIVDLEIKPEVGKALVWNNQKPNGDGNPYTEHWGMPVIKGEKYIITKWMREKPAIRQIS